MKSFFLTRRFLPFWLTLFCGALNDNLFKTGLILYVAFQIPESDLLTVTIGGLFILPFGLFSGLAGQLADKYSPARLTYLIKGAEIGIMSLGAMFFLLGNVYGLLFVLFLMGAQSAFFGPIKYSILPRYLETHELVAGNALVQGGTYLAILLGLLSSGLLLQQGELRWISGIILLVALLGWVASRAMPSLTSAVPKLRLSRNPFQSIWDVLRSSLEIRLQRVILLAIAWFWFIGACYVNIFPIFVRDQLCGEEILSSVLLTCFALGICFGCLICTLISAGRILPALAIPSLIGISLASLELYFSSDPGCALTASGSLATTLGGWRLFLGLGLAAASAGAYIVPLYSLLQQRVPTTQRARVMAASGVIDALAIIGSSAFCALLTLIFNLFELDSNGMFLIFGASNLLFLIELVRRAPDIFLPRRSQKPQKA